MSDQPRTTNQDLLMRILTDIAEIKATVKNYADLELRVRSLEKTLWSNAWVTGVLSAAISSGIVFVIVNTFF